MHYKKFLNIWTDEEQDALIKRAEQMMVEQDPERFPDVEEALKILVPDPTCIEKIQVQKKLQEKKN